MHKVPKDRVRRLKEFEPVPEPVTSMYDGRPRPSPKWRNALQGEAFVTARTDYR